MVADNMMNDDILLQYQRTRGLGGSNSTDVQKGLVVKDGKTQEEMEQDLQATKERNALLELMYSELKAEMEGIPIFMISRYFINESNETIFSLQLKRKLVDMRTVSHQKHLLFNNRQVKSMNMSNLLQEPPMEFKINPTSQI